MFLILPFHLHLHFQFYQGTPVIYVNFNYRLGPLGFPQGSEMDEKGMLNVGLKDSLLAFQWINKNIAAFGGDPAKVRAHRFEGDLLC